MTAARDLDSPCASPDSNSCAMRGAAVVPLPNPEPARSPSSSSSGRRRPVQSRRESVGCTAWDTAEVARRVRALGEDWADDRFISLLREHEVDGPALAELTKADLRDEFGIRELGRIKRVLRSIAALCEGSNPSPPGSRAVATPEPGAFDVPISEEDLVGRVGCTVEGSQAQAPQPPRPAPPAPTLPNGHRPAPPQTTRSSASPPPRSPSAPVRATSAGGRAGSTDSATQSGADDDADADSSCDDRAAAANPRRPASCPPNPTQTARQAPTSCPDVDDDDIDAIDLADLVPDRGRSLAGRSALPPRPVTAIGHRPTVDDSDDEEGARVAVLPANHRHVWEDDPAVEIRHPSDPERDLGARMTPPPGHLIGRAEEPPPSRLAWARAPRPAPIPRPPAETGARLPNGKAVPQWVFRRWDPPPPQERSKKGLEVLAGAETGKAVHFEGQVYPCGILEQERRYGAVRALFDSWDSTLDRGGSISLAEVQSVLEVYCSWAPAEAEEKTHSLMQHVDTNVDGQLDWPEFNALLSAASKSASPAEFDAMLRHFHDAVDAAASKSETARRSEALARLFADWDTDKSGRIEHRELWAVVQRVNQSVDDDHGLPHTLTVAPEADCGGKVDLAQFRGIMLAATAECSQQQFDLAMFRTGRVLAELNEGALHCPPRAGSGAPVTASALERIAVHASQRAPVLLLGSDADPSKAVERCAEGRGATLRPFLVSSEKTERAAQRAVTRLGFGKGLWIYVLVSRGYQHADRFLRELGLRLETEAPWAIHRAFRLWVFAPGLSESSVPSVLLLRSVCVPLSSFDPDAIVRRLQSSAAEPCSGRPAGRYGGSRSSDAVP
eukprot:TRINITY_DN32708_c0_g1_i1.p1 TRINITY_DN32708_c0_g1~~TRINITY_DN32708_c0_g1_i1.p1  ORF type:complete len:841 (+),score=175.90 TRINITY_DN32708_c0_g1_i1:63-2585(+)